MSYTNQVYYKSSENMEEVPDNSVNLIVTSPPYFNIKDYTKDGAQKITYSNHNTQDIGNINIYDHYLSRLTAIWHECKRILTPNGKLAINAPLIPMLKRDMSTHYNRDILNIYGDIERAIKHIQDMYLMDVFIWNRTNTVKKLMFGSYPYPRNFYAQNTIEFIGIFVKEGKPKDTSSPEKEKSKLSQQEWVEYTKQIWDIPIPNKSDTAYGTHSALMPEEIARRCIKLYTYTNDIVLDPFTGSGTTLKVAKELRRQYIGYEIYPYYKETIDIKLQQETLPI